MRLSRSTVRTVAVLCAGLLTIGLASVPAVAASPVPSAPTGITVAPGDASAVLHWRTPRRDGGAPITGYTISASPGGETVRTSVVNSYTVGGLTNGTSYTFTIRARNDNGLGARGVSDAVVPTAPTVPGAAGDIQASAGFTAATVSWSAPADDGGAPITGYTVMSSPDDIAVSVGGEARTATVRGLSNGTAYTFTVTATNAVGEGPSSDASASVTPDVTVPEPPATVSAAPAGGAVTVSWTAPVSDGGSPLTGYVVTADPGGASATTDAYTTTTTIAGLSDGTTYTFSVAATNDLGTGAAANTAPTDPAVTVASNTVALSDESLAALESVSNDGTLVFSDAPVQVTGLTAGDVVVVGISSQTPMGLLRKVVDVTNDGALTTVTTTQASLDEAISDGAVSLDGTLARQDVEEFTPARPGVRLAPASVGGDPSMTITIDVDLYKDKLGRRVHVAGTETITPHVSFSASVHCCFHINAHFQASLEAESKLQLTAELSKEIESGLPLARVTFPPIEFSVGPVPVVIVPVLDVSLEASGSVSVGVTTALTHTDTMGVKIDTDNGDVDAQPINEHSTSFTPPTLFEAAEVKAGPRARLTMYLYGVAGPYVQNTLYLIDLSANTAEDPWWSLKIDDSIGAGFRISLLGHTIADWSADPLLEFSQPIADAGGPYMGVTITPDPAEVAPRHSLTLTAHVERSSAQKVVWSVESGGGRITQQGVYTAPHTPGTYQVTATSPANGLKPETKGVVDVVVGAQPPDKPSGVTATSDRYGQARVSWTAPSDDGGSAITGYELQTAPGTFVYATPGSATTAVVTGLHPGSEYRFSVRALNGVDTGQWSAASAPVLISDVIPPGTGVLIVGTGDYGNVSGADWLNSTLTGDGYTVVERYADSLPADLRPFDQIWVYTTNGLSTTDQNRLVSYAESGHGVYLTGERPCCEAANESDSAIVNQVVPGGGVTIGGLGDPFYAYGQVQLNPTAVGGSTTTPYAPTAWTVDAPGGMDGVSGDNVFASVSGPGSTVLGAVWDSSEVTGGGRVAVLMDINWCEQWELDPVTAPQISADLALFLSGLSAPPSPPSDPVATPVSVGGTSLAASPTRS